jgi:hypothetical protein
LHERDQKVKRIGFSKNPNSVTGVVSAGWELTINAFPPGRVLKEYCRAEAMDDATGVLSCTVVETKQQIYCADSLEVLQIWSA